jgi:hypothetical protein
MLSDTINIDRKQKNAHKLIFLSSNPCIFQIFVVTLQPKVAKIRKNNLITDMEATLKQPVMHYAETISEEKWNSLHTVEELDASLKGIIHNHFHG